MCWGGWPATEVSFYRGMIQLHGTPLPMAEPRAFAAWLRLLFRHDWVVYSKRPFGGPETVLRYLGAYTHRVAISNRRLVTLSESGLGVSPPSGGANAVAGC